MNKGVSRELARIALPVSVYTEWYWKIDLHNLFHFLSLRMDPHAQQEIRDYANAMFELIRPIVPIAAEAFLDYHLGGLHLPRAPRSRPPPRRRADQHDQQARGRRVGREAEEAGIVNDRDSACMPNDA